MTTYGLCFAWDCDGDVAFVDLLVEACRDERLSLLQATPANLDGVLAGVNAGEAGFRAYFDRASDEEPRFEPLAAWARAHCPCRINPHELAERAWDKAEMHAALSSVLHTPPTLILPPFREQPDLPPLDLGVLGPSFTIKPAYGGGGTGVVTCISPDRIPAARQTFPDTKYMLQSHIVPVRLDGRPAWFRILHAGGKYYPCWWDDRTHVYTTLTCAAEDHYGLRPLRGIVETIAHITGLHLFSTEVALSPEGKFLVIDYVNNPVDLRPQSKTPDGVPNLLLRFIARDIARLVARELARANHVQTDAA
ncbi:MAG: hypothetical protein FJ291_02845 [Planctomycetes bacterium]|nr:hypothetical protein [Planctomycetota bacterium]